MTGPARLSPIVAVAIAAKALAFAHRTTFDVAVAAVKTSRLYATIGAPLGRTKCSDKISACNIALEDVRFAIDPPNAAEGSEVFAVVAC